MTEYVIFSKFFADEKTQETSPLWSLLGTVEAASSSAAIRNYINGGPGSTLLHPDNAGEYVAVPARSWQPVKVAVETALKFST